MKIHCHCGAQIYDSTDNLPHKAHLAHDEGGFAAWDALDELIEIVATGRLTPDAAAMQARRIFSAGQRPMWQCRSCGRLYLDGPDGTLQCFMPSSPETDKQVLRKTRAD